MPEWQDIFKVGGLVGIVIGGAAASFISFTRTLSGEKPSPPATILNGELNRVRDDLKEYFEEKFRDLRGEMLFNINNLTDRLTDGRDQLYARMDGHERRVEGRLQGIDQRMAAGDQRMASVEAERRRRS